MMVGFGGLRDIKDGKFSVSVFFFVLKFQKRFFCYEFSMTDGLGGLRDLIDGRFLWVTRSQ